MEELARGVEREKRRTMKGRRDIIILDNGASKIVEI